MRRIRDILRTNPVVPVVTLDRIEDTAPVCEALIEGGITVIEFTLRTAIAMKALGEAIKRFPELTVGAGTIVSSEQVTRVADLGAQFGVCPGATSDILNAAEATKLPFLPGGATVSEFMVLSERGFDIIKFFPAVPSGGLNFLKSIASPLSKIDFCPTGGITAANVAEYLELKNVIAVGGSWIASSDRTRRRAWNEIKLEASSVSKKFNLNLQ